MLHKTLFNNGKIQWIVLGRDPGKPETVIDTNEYVVISGDEVLVVDPGGVEIFPSVLTALSEVVEISKVKSYLCSHQDPDIMSSLSLWMGLTPKARIYLSWLWSGFVSHFGNQYTANMELVPDEGRKITVGESTLQLVPAHFLHSEGNFHLFDSQSGILFSGDVGAGLVPPDYPLFVEDFESHTRFMEGFHRRWMPSNEAKNDWVRRVRRLGVKMICPQHGAIIRGDDVAKFLDWFEALEVGKTRISA